MSCSVRIGYIAASSFIRAWIFFCFRSRHSQRQRKVQNGRRWSLPPTLGKSTSNLSQSDDLEYRAWSARRTRSGVNSVWAICKIVSYGQNLWEVSFRFVVLQNLYFTLLFVEYFLEGLLVPFGVTSGDLRAGGPCFDRQPGRIDVHNWRKT
jgi:hypothetical protein